MHIASEVGPISALTYSEIVPSPVIEANQQFSFRAGDGGNGYYADRPRPWVP